MTPVAVVPPESAMGSAPVDMPGGRLAWTSVLWGALVVTLVRPLSWAVGLAGFLAGGGVLLVTLPVMVLPTPTGVQNALGGPVSTLVFGTPSALLVVLVAAGVASTLLIAVAGVVAGAWAERQGVALALEAAGDEGILPGAPPPVGAAPTPMPGTARVAVVRALSLLPVVVVALLAWPSLYDAAYRELVLPDDLSTPLPLRVIRGVPAPLAAVALAWVLADTAGAVAVRRLLIGRRPVLVAWLLGWADLVRRPLRLFGTAIVGILVLGILVAPAMLAALTGWARVREVALDGRDPAAMLVAVAIWVAIWLGGLVLAGVGAAFRAAAYTLELPRGA